MNIVTYDWPYRYSLFAPAELERMWEDQAMYPKDHEGMQSALHALYSKVSLVQGVKMDLDADTPTCDIEPGIGDFDEVLERIDGANGADFAKVDLVRWVD